jgi:four helix bundle protein
LTYFNITAIFFFSRCLIFKKEGGRFMPFMFEKLEVYQKAVDLAERIARLTWKFPRRTYYLTDQLNRAALSIAANLAEGNGRWHKGDRRQFFWIARGSAQECLPILEVCRRLEFLDEQVHKELKTEIEVIGKMICGLIHGLEIRSGEVVEK